MARTDMRWPNSSQFDTAVQLAAFHPGRELAGASVSSAPNGFLHRFEGANATAYLLRTRSADTILRCFKQRPSAEVEGRYRELAQRVAKAGHPVLAHARWLEQAVRIDGTWWPAVVMEHVGGKSLRAFVRARLDDPAALGALADEWLRIVRLLAADGLEHGDLQHDNIRVRADGRVRLIDLDAVWTPALAKFTPNESGHPNFQHPERLRTGSWGPGTDRFSALVVLLSLRALAADPELWDEYHDDDNLLFTAADFGRVMQDELWFRLASSRDLEVRRLTALLARACTGALADVPGTGELAGPRPGQPVRPPGWPEPRPAAPPGPRSTPSPAPDAGPAPVAEPVQAPVPAPPTAPVPAGAPTAVRTPQDDDPAAHRPPTPHPARRSRVRSASLAAVAVLVLVAVVVAGVMGFAH